jgi:hypothetical protein
MSSSLSPAVTDAVAVAVVSKDFLTLVSTMLLIPTSQHNQHHQQHHHHQKSLHNSSINSSSINNDEYDKDECVSLLLQLSSHLARTCASAAIQYALRDALTPQILAAALTYKVGVGIYMLVCFRHL